MDLGMAGRVAIVTGASRGLGRAIAEELVREGVAVAACARSEEDLSRAAEDLRALGGTIHAQPCDVTDPHQIEGFVAAAVEALGGLDFLVNNAGMATPGAFETLTDDAWHRDLDVKLLSMIRFTRAALPHFRARGGGRIVNVNSVLGRSPDPALFATSVNRAACLALTKTLALELAGENILVNSVNIGSVVSSQWANIHAKRAPELSEEEFFRRTGEHVPVGRMGRPDEVSGVVAFLLSDRASYVTGASVDVAGGAGGHI